MTRSTATGSRRERPDPVRWRAEREFHDRWAQSVDVEALDPHRVFNSPVIPESRYSIQVLGPLKGKRVLDLGCGYGETSAYLALQGADVDAVDISIEMVRRTRQLAARCGVSGSVNASVQKGEVLAFADRRFDIVYGQDVLHHLNLDQAIAELHRVLKPDGRGCFSEPLGHNRIINYFRDRTPEVRTPDETPLLMSDIRRFHQTFRSVEHREFHLSTLAIFVWFHLLDLVQRRGDGRPWKRIIDEAALYRRPFAVLYALDRALFAVAPFCKRYCRMTVISFVK